MKTSKFLMTSASAAVLATSLSVASADDVDDSLLEGGTIKFGGYTFVGHVPAQGTANISAFIPTVEDTEVGAEIAALEEASGEYFADWKTVNN